MIGYLISIFLLLLCFYLFKKFQKEQDKLKDLHEKNLDELKVIYHNALGYEETELQLAKNRVIEQENKITQLQREIKEKQTFNEGLKKVREEELDRLIAAERNTKMVTLNHELENYRSSQQAQIDKNLQIASLAAAHEQQTLLLQLEELKDEIEEFRLKRESINEATRREREVQEQSDFYRILLSEADEEDIKYLKSLSDRIHNKEALARLIYDVYIKRPLDEMCKRVLGAERPSGIYKITYVPTGEAYIGQSTNVFDRWHNHLKTVAGLQGAAHQTIHTQIQQKGISNFTFELLEKVAKENLNEREKFYINLYGTKNQFNMKEGG